MRGRPRHFVSFSVAQGTNGPLFSPEQLSISFVAPYTFRDGSLEVPKSSDSSGCVFACSEVSSRVFTVAAGVLLPVPREVFSGCSTATRDHIEVHAGKPVLSKVLLRNAGIGRVVGNF